MVAHGRLRLAFAGRDAPGVIYRKAGPRATPVWISAEEAATPEKDGLRREEELELVNLTLCTHNCTLLGV